MNRHGHVRLYCWIYGCGRNGWLRSRANNQKGKVVRRNVIGPRMRVGVLCFTCVCKHISKLSTSSKANPWPCSATNITDGWPTITANGMRWGAQTPSSDARCCCTRGWHVKKRQIEATKDRHMISSRLNTVTHRNACEPVGLLEAPSSSSAGELIVSSGTLRRSVAMVFCASGEGASSAVTMWVVWLLFSHSLSEGICRF
jgi:hypothetical protein